MVVDSLAVQVDYVFFTAGAVGRPNVLLREHGGFLVGFFVLHCHQHLVELLDLSQENKIYLVNQFH